MAVKVHGRGLSPFVRVALLVLAEKGVDFELVVGDQKALEYLENINPFGKHPALEIDGFILYESRAIARFIASKYESQGPNLLGSTPEERALVDQWVEVEGHTFQPPVFQIILEKYFKPVVFKKETNEAVVEENCDKEMMSQALHDLSSTPPVHLDGERGSHGAWISSFVSLFTLSDTVLSILQIASKLEGRGTILVPGAGKREGPTQRPSSVNSRQVSNRRRVGAEGFELGSGNAMIQEPCYLREMSCCLFLDKGLGSLFA